jgi:hypothetical protein
MADLKKSFIIHLDSLDVLDELDIEQAGQLFHAFRAYNLGKQVELTGLLKAVFIPFKNQFDRDLEKYNSIVVRNRENGLKGGKPRQTQTNPVGILGTQTNPNKPDNDNDSNNDSDSDNEKDKVKENNIEQRKLKFADTLKPFLTKYSKDMLNDFYKYWSQPNKSGSKFKQELEKTWELSYRLERWSKNDKSFNKSENKDTSIKLAFKDGKPNN